MRSFERRLALSSFCGQWSRVRIAANPGSGFPKQPSQSVAHPERLESGKISYRTRRALTDPSAFRILRWERTGFAARLANVSKAAERTLDVQYYIFSADSTGLLVTDSLLAAG